MKLYSLAKEIRWIAFICWRRFSLKFNSIRRFMVAPKVPSNKDGRTLVHLGCGDVNWDGYLNVDLKPAPHVHHVHDVTSLPFLAGESVDMLYACHVLEHFPHERLKEILWEWRRVLKYGGTLRLSVPDFDKLLFVYSDSKNDVESIRLPLMGSDDGYFSHLILFNFDFLKALLEANGFSNVRSWDPNSAKDYQFNDWASKCMSYRGKEYFISLNVEAEKCRRH